MTKVTTLLQSFATQREAEAFIETIRVPEGDEVGILAVPIGDVFVGSDFRYVVVMRSQLVDSLGWEGQT